LPFETRPSITSQRARGADKEAEDKTTNKLQIAAQHRLSVGIAEWLLGKRDPRWVT
jgi:hypothetical protein